MAFFLFLYTICFSRRFSLHNIFLSTPITFLITHPLELSLFSRVFLQALESIVFCSLVITRSFVFCLLFLLFCVICAPVPAEGTLFLLFLCLVRSTDTMRKRWNPLVNASYMANRYVIRIKFHWGFSYVTRYMKHYLLATKRVISSIITRNFFVTRNKQPMTVGTNRMCN